MKSRNILLIVGAIIMPFSALSANPKKDAEPMKKITDQDFMISSLLHRIYEHSIQAEKVEAKLKNDEKERSPHDEIPAANLKLVIKRLEAIADVPSFKAKLAKDLAKIKKSRLGPKHPTRRWLELLSQSLEKCSKPSK